MNDEIKKIRSNAVLLCPDNDSEAHMILELAEKAGVATIRSLQPHGAKLELEPELDSKLANFNKNELWIVETPGPEKEAELKNRGINVTIIDHHTYNDIDRLVDTETGANKPSSLEQFLTIAKIDDEEIRKWGFDPKVVRGIGIMDAKYVRGLREANYSKEEMSSVFKLKDEITKKIRPDFGKILKLAEQDWNNRTERNGYLIIKSEHGGDMRNAISELSILNEMDTTPMIVSIRGGDKISVQNVSDEIVEKLKKTSKLRIHIHLDLDVVGA